MALLFRGVHTHGLGDFTDVGPRGLADRTDSVDARDPLSEEGVCDQLAQLRAPGVHGQDMIPWDPMAVDGGQGRDSLVPLRRLLAADQNPIRVPEILDCVAFCQKLGIR